MNSNDVLPFLEDFYLANTPGYLLRKTLANPRLEEILSRYTDSELEEAVHAYDTNSATSAERAAGYVALIALLKRGSQGAIDRFSLWTPNYLAWASALISEWDAARRATTWTTLNYAPTIVAPANQQTSAFANSATQVTFADAQQ
ncbi:MAG TPA: hypothetical protein VK794_04800 [Steroidobacteraceae bacterium]|jgi:hypothetical protein|nr:hypothetical protein [Steroidobacteraceae bacterium]